MNIIHNIRNISTVKAVIVIIAVGFLVYGNTIVNEMFWDDYDNIVNNQYIHSWEHFPKYFSENLIAGAGIINNYWRPLLLLSFSVDYKIGGLEPFAYHLQNIFWHIVASILILILARKLAFSIFAGLLAALFFLVHPLQTEAVTYIAGRADPMHVALMLAGLIYFIKAVQGVFSRKYYFGAIAFFILALLVRERSIIFILLIFLYLIILYNKNVTHLWRKKIIYILPFVAIGIVYVVLRSTILHFEDNFDEIREHNISSFGWYSGILVYLKAFAIYIKLIFWPAQLYMTRIISMPKGLWDPYVISGVILTGTVVFSSIRLFKKEKIFIFGIFWFFIALIPTLYTIQMQGFLAEHWLYPALPGLFIVLAFYLDRLMHGLKSVYILHSVLIIVLSVLILFSIRTIIRNTDWQNPIRFYEKNISLGGKSAIIYTNLGMAYADKKEYDKAVDMYKIAIINNEYMFQPWYNMGNIYRIRKEDKQSLEAYQKAIECNKGFLPAYKNSAIVYIEQGKYEKAINIMNAFINSFPYNANALYDTAIIYYQKGDHKKAKEYMRRVLEIQPDNKEVQKLLFF